MVNGCFLIENKLFVDNRGYLSEVYQLSKHHLLAKQINVTYSKKHTLRGIHRAPYAKIVTCIKGKIFDACVDLRHDSSTYNQHYAVTLSEDRPTSIYIPPMCGHAFLALEDSIILYFQTEEYNPRVDETYCYLKYNIQWPTDIQYISQRDKNICYEMDEQPTQLSNDDDEQRRTTS